MTQPKRGLGRGLDALIPGRPAPPPAEETPAGDDTGSASHDGEGQPVSIDPPASEAPPQQAPPEPAPAAPARRSGPETIDIDLISPNPEQPRTHFEPERLRELAESITQHGIIQPLVVSRDPQGGYRLIAGERRLQAARLAGLQDVPVILRETEEAELLELALIENIQRDDLNAIEEAQAYRRLLDEYGLTQDEAARRVGKSRTAVTNALRLLQLEPEIRRSLVGGEISEGHARALLGLTDSKQRVEAWRDVVKRHLSVRDTEAQVRRRLNQANDGGNTPSASPSMQRRDVMIIDIERRLQRSLSTRVSVQPQKKGARIVIECYSAEEFDSVVERITGESSNDEDDE